MNIDIRNLWIEAIGLTTCEKFVSFQLFSFELQTGCCGTMVHFVLFNFEINIYSE